MPIYEFSGISVRDGLGSPAAGATGSLYDKDDTSFSTPLETTDLNGLPLTLTADVYGMLPDFQVDHNEPRAVWKSSDPSLPVVSLLSLDGVVEMGAAAESAAVAAASDASAAKDEAAATAAEVDAFKQWVDLGVTTYNLAARPRPIPSQGLANVVMASVGAWSDGAGTMIIAGTDDVGVVAIRCTMPPTSLVSGGDFIRVDAPSQRPVTPGKWYGFMIQIGSVGTAQSFRAAIGFPGISASAGEPAMVSGLTYLTHIAQAPEEATLAYFDVDYGPTPILWEAGDGADVRRVMIVEGSSRAAVERTLNAGYFDGDTPSTSNAGYAWEGTPLASRSKKIDFAAVSTDLVAAAEAAQAAAEAAASADLPAGGNAGQVLTKNSGQDRDVTWANPPSGGGGGTTEWSSVLGKPATFPPSPHSHPLAQLTGSTGLGRQILAADDPQGARALIGAGTGNGTSNLTLGSTANTAAPGNHTHSGAAISFAPSGPITATNVQDAIEQAAATGGAGGTSQVLVWRYQAGAYPTLPASKPEGVLTVEAQGPVQPPSVPSWVGTGASQATLFYQWAPLT